MKAIIVIVAIGFMSISCFALAAPSKIGISPSSREGAAVSLASYLTTVNGIADQMVRDGELPADQRNLFADLLFASNVVGSGLCRSITMPTRIIEPMAGLIEGIKQHPKVDNKYKSVNFIAYAGATFHSPLSIIPALNSFYILSMRARGKALWGSGDPKYWKMLPPTTQSSATFAMKCW